MLRRLARLFSASPTAPTNRRRAHRPSLEALENREVPATVTSGVANWDAQVFTPYINVLQGLPNGDRLNYLQAAQQANVKYLTLGFIDADGQGRVTWQGDAGSALGSDMDDYISAQVDALRQTIPGGDVMVSFGGAGATELAQSVARRLGTGPAAVTALVGQYQQVIDAYHLTHLDFDIEGAQATDRPSIGLRSQALAQLQGNNPGLYIQFTLQGEVPFEADLKFGMDANALAIVNSALDAGVDIGNVNLMTMDFSNWVNYYDDTPENHQLYGVQINPAHFPYAGDRDAQQGIHNVPDVATRNADAEFIQLSQALTAHGVAKTDAEVWRMVGITPEIGRNFTNESDQGQQGDSNVIFSLADAQALTAYAESKGVGLLAMWSLGRDQSGNPSNTRHSETNSSVEQNPYQFSQIFSSFGDAEPGNRAPFVVSGARASANPVRGQTVTLSALGGDDGGEGSLTYTWATTGTPPAAVGFSANGTNDARETTATFTRAGTYSFLVTIRDAEGLSTTSSLTVIVSPKATAIAITPGSARVVVGGTQRFTARLVDQFGNAMTARPVFTWSVVGRGSVSSTGLYRAPMVASSAVVRAKTGTLRGSATVGVVTARASFADTDDWGTGFTGYITVTNRGKAVNGWTLEFDFAGDIYEMWDGAIVSHVGDHYTVRNADWNGVIGTGRSVKFGFNANWPAARTMPPSNFILNGVAIAG